LTGFSSVEQEEYAEYEDRIVAFCDILAWGNWIKRSELDPSIVQSLVDRTDQISHLPELINNVKAQAKEIPFGLEAAHWSDSSVVSCRDEPQAMITVLRGTCDFANDLLCGGLLCRGAIVRGKLYHRGNRMFGPAFLVAYEMEQQCAVYPRILIADEIVAALGHSPEHQKYIRRDSDGLHFLDTFSRQLPASGNVVDANCIASFQEFRKIISDGLQKHGSDPKKRMKWMWLAKRFNEVVAEFPRLNVNPIQLST
jgi:hypothetical protein